MRKIFETPPLVVYAVVTAISVIIYGVPTYISFNYVPEYPIAPWIIMALGLLDISLTYLVLTFAFILRKKRDVGEDTYVGI